MNLLPSTVSPWRARQNRLRWWWSQRLGWVGVLGLALLLGAALTVAVVRPQVADEHEQLLSGYVARMDLASRMGTVSGGAVSDPRDTAREALPLQRERGVHVARLLAHLERVGAAIARADYTLEDTEPGLARLRVALPFQGSYRAARALIVAILNAMPNAALDSVELNRGDGAELQGELHLSLYFRREAP